MLKNKLYQCPFNYTVKCDYFLRCYSCEVFQQTSKVVIPRNNTIDEIRTVINGRGDSVTKVLKCKDILSR